jgi:hypothetical protein
MWGSGGMCKGQFEKAGVFARQVVCKARLKEPGLCGKQGECARASLRKQVYSQGDK